VFLEEAKLALDARLDGVDGTLAEALLRPTRIYVRSLRRLAAAGLLKGAAHITGGGLVDNPTRMLPAGARLKLQIDLRGWAWPALFQHLARLGNVAPEEMRRTFNVGIGMIVAVPEAQAAEARRLLEAEGEAVHAIGRVAAAEVADGPVEFLG
jgi:phosphoribosylformylglycinamidine cyclo-ligase